MYSNTRHQGEILELVQTMLPGITKVCLNKNVVCGKHTDSKNNGPSFIYMFGDYTSGGQLNLADGRVFEDERKWHGPYDGANILHWNTPHSGEIKYSIVAFS